jgi:hypothetical protein
MKLRTFKTLDNDIYQATLYTQDWSEADRALMVKFGEPEIDLGGTFDSGETSFELPHKLERLMTQSPFNQSFDARDAADAQNRAAVWATEIATRISAAVTTMRAETDDYSTETVQTI